MGTVYRNGHFYPGSGNDSGGGGGHTIEDETGTELTQRMTMQFGNGMSASDDSTDEKTVVEVDTMPSTDMHEIITPLPSITARYQKYSTEEQVIGEWIDGKPVYQKTINFGALPNNTMKAVAHGISNLGTICSIKKVFDLASSPHAYYDDILSKADIKNQAVFWVTPTDIAVNVSSNCSNYTLVVTLQYTKTTD